MPASNIVVVDSNVLITLIVPASLSTHVLARLDAAGWEVAASPQVLALKTPASSLIIIRKGGDSGALCHGPSLRII